MSRTNIRDMYPGFGFQERKSHALLSFPSIGVEREFLVAVFYGPSKHGSECNRNSSKTMSTEPLLLDFGPMRGSTGCK